MIATPNTVINSLDFTLRCRITRLIVLRQEIRGGNNRRQILLCLTVQIDPISASATRAGLLSLLALLVIGLCIVALPGLISDEKEAGDSALTQSSSTTTVLETTDFQDVSPTALLAIARISAEGIVLDGTVSTEGQRDALVDAARRRVGPALVEDRLDVATGLTSSEGRDNGVVALQSFITGVPDGVTIAATTTADQLEVVGEATDATAAAGVERALTTAIAGSPGMASTNTVEVPPPPPPTEEELRVAAQDELTSLNTLLAAEVLYATSSNEPTEEFKSLLDRVPDLLVRHPSVTVEIVGHTDDRGSEGGNQKLSDQRARAAFDYLVESGVDPTRLSSRGAGEGEPIATNSTRDGRAANRRVELRAR